MSDTTAVGQGDLGPTATTSTPATPTPATPTPATPTPAPTPTPATPNAGTEPQSISTGTFGVLEGDPVWWVASAVGSDVATAHVTFANGSTDEMTPVNGIVVLAHHVTPAAASDPYAVVGTVQFLDAAGTVLGTVTLPEPVVTSPPPPVPVPLPYPAAKAGGGNGTVSGRVSGRTATTPVAVSSGPASMPPVFACPMAPLTSGSPATVPPGAAAKNS